MGDRMVPNPKKNGTGNNNNYVTTYSWDKSQLSDDTTNQKL
jgi:hypothetical protein